MLNVWGSGPGAYIDDEYQNSPKAPSNVFATKVRGLVLCLGPLRLFSNSCPCT